MKDDCADDHGQNGYMLKGGEVATVVHVHSSGKLFRLKDPRGNVSIKRRADYAYVQPSGTTPHHRQLVGDSSNKKISDSAITASSAYPTETNGLRACRFDRCGWATATNANPADWIQFDLGSVKLISEVQTKGQSNAGQWVTEFEVLCSMSGSQWSSKGVFLGNKDRNSSNVNVFQPVLVARYLRIVPLRIHGAKVMRIEFSQSEPKHVTAIPIPPTSTTTLKLIRHDATACPVPDSDSEDDDL